MLLQTSDKVKSVHSAYWLCYIPLYMNHIFISFAVISYIVLQEHIEHKGLKTFTVYIKFHATIWLDDEKMWKMMWNSSSNCWFSHSNSDGWRVPHHKEIVPLLWQSHLQWAIEDENKCHIQCMSILQSGASQMLGYKTSYWTRDQEPWGKTYSTWKIV